MGTSAWILPGTGNFMLDQVRTRAFFRNQHITGGSWFFVRMNLDDDLTVSNGGCGKQPSFWRGSISRDSVTSRNSLSSTRMNYSSPPSQFLF